MFSTLKVLPDVCLCKNGQQTLKYHLQSMLKNLSEWFIVITSKAISDKTSETMWARNKSQFIRDKSVTAMSLSFANTLSSDVAQLL